MPEEAVDPVTAFMELSLDEQKAKTLEQPLMPEPPNSDERLKGALLVVAILTAAIRLRGEPITNTPKVISTVHDSIKLARLVLRI
jgi:hypothetical protein